MTEETFDRVVSDVVGFCRGYLKVQPKPIAEARPRTTSKRSVELYKGSPPIRLNYVESWNVNGKFQFKRRSQT